MMSTVSGLFANLVATGSATDDARSVPTGSSWMSVNVSISAIAPGTTATFEVQWSFDGATWCDANPEDIIGTTTAPASVIQRLDVKAPYWRLALVLTGATPSVTVTGNVFYA